MKKLCTLFALLLCCYYVQAQNLVPNNGFENLISPGCGVYGSGMLATATGNWKDANAGSADIVTTQVATSCAMHPTGSGNYWGRRAPHTGKSYAAVITYCSACASETREYPQTQLTAPMVAGQTYQVDFWICMAPNTGYVTNNFGAYFSTTPVSSGSWTHLPYTPQVVFTQLLTDSVNWVHLSSTFTPAANYNYITIGNFYSDAATTIVTNTVRSNLWAVYYVDDLNVSPLVNTPTADFSATSPICSGGCVTYTNLSTNASTYQWSFPGGTPSNSIQQSPTVCYATPGNYSATLIAGNGTVEDTMTKANYILVNPPAAAGTIQAVKDSICTGASASFTATASTGNLQWQSSANGITFTNISGATSAAYTTPSLTQDTYYRIMVSGCGADSSASKLIHILPRPIPGTVTAVPDSICAGQPVQLTVTGNTGSLQWQSSLNGVLYSTIPGATSTAYTTGPVTQSTYYRVQATNQCGSDTSGSALVTVLPSPLAGALTASRDSMCEGTGQTSTLTLSGSMGNLQWASSTDGVNYTPLGVSVTTYTTPPGLAQTTYYRVIATAGFSCPPDTCAPLIIHIQPFPVAFYTETVNGSTVTFNSGGSSSDVISYSWSFDDGGSSTQANPTHTYATADTFEVCLTVYNGSNCSYTYCKDVIISNGSGIEDVAWASVIYLYPNPAGQIIYLSAESLKGEYELRLYNTLGQLMRNEKLTFVPGATHTIYLENLAAGNYHLVLNNERAYFSSRFIRIK